MNTSKRILVISHLPIMPATAGNKIRVWALMNNLRALGHDVWFMGLGLKPAEEQAIRAAWGDNLIVVPHLKARHIRPISLGIKRWLLDRAISNGWVNADLDYRIWPHWDEAIRKVAGEQKFDVVMAEYVFYSKALLHFDGAIKVIDTHDVFTDRAQKLRARNIKSYYWSLPRAEEARGLARADVILAIQKHEAAFFQELTEGRKRVMVAGHTVALRPLPAVGGAGKNMLFVGTRYAANVDGVKFFIEKVLPLVHKKYPEARLLVAGTVCGALRAGTPGVELLGVVDDLDEAYRRAAIVVNPVLTGTGLKTKTVEALGHAKALVTTACGAEGIEDAAGEAFLMADDPAQMAAHIAGLLQSPARADHLAQCGFHFAAEWNEAQIETLRRLPLPADAGAAESGGKTAGVLETLAHH
ncbi:MAG TPA: glycosyltransferase [Chthoniobacteraceae bacterium]|jgi:glycosyltransferase involved in cell wall biosynthesis|nr:glycosyltransferase [Chthoniobacteraceae bacterium]